MFRLDGAAPRPACVSCECLRRSGVELGAPQINTMSHPLPTPARKSGLPTAYARIILSGSRTRPSVHRLDTSNGPSSMLMQHSISNDCPIQRSAASRSGAPSVHGRRRHAANAERLHSPLPRGSTGSWTGHAAVRDSDLILHPLPIDMNG